MLSLSTKVQILLLLTVIFVSLYLFIIQKELKLVQMDVNELKNIILKIKEEGLVSGSTSTEKSVTDETQLKGKTESIVENAEVVKNVEDDVENIEDEEIEESEIRELLTNITLIDTDDNTNKDAENVKQYDSYSREELEKEKYDDLRAYLRKNGENSKGKKTELIDIILCKK